MPKTAIPANGNRTPALTRRGVLAGTAAAAASGAAPSPAAALPGGADAELLALAQKFAEGLDILHAAERRRNACEKRYFAERPDKPEALTRAGPLGKLLSPSWDWWDADELEGLIENRVRRRYWATARQLLPVAHAYEAKLDRCEQACGLTAAEAAQTAASNALDDLIDQIVAAPARTLAGLAVKARIVKFWAHPEWWRDDPEDADPMDCLVTEVLDAVIGMSGS
jgi:hypothetical protein